jgi:hypothetical protein
MKPKGRTLAIAFYCAALLMCTRGAALAQSTATSQEVGEVLQQIKVLNDSLRQTRAELEESRAEIRELKVTVEGLEAKLPVDSSSVTNALPTAVQPVTATEEDLQMLTERVDEHQQTKVESASKLRIKLSGMVLLNAFSNSGNVDSVDLPTVALPRSAAFSAGSIGGSVRQSIVGLTGYGPDFLGARTSADVQMDFFGGIPSGYSGASSGIVRLRLARLRLDWHDTSLVGGVDTPFFSPNSPTSYATVGEPAFAAAGNLWAWTPSLRVEHRFNSQTATWKLEAGLFDPTGYAGYAPQNRFPSAGESARQPAYSVRFSGTHGESDHALSLGVAGIYSPLRFYGGQHTHGAGGMVDWRIPMTRYFQVTGEFFAGKGLEGFGGTPYSQVSAQESQHYAYVTSPLLAGIGETGGWSEVTLKASAKNEFNVAAGYGGFAASAMRRAISRDYYFASLLSRNESVLVNYVVRPRSDLLFSAEYRHLRTTAVSGNTYDANLVGVAAGFLF